MVGPSARPRGGGGGGARFEMPRLHGTGPRVAGFLGALWVLELVLNAAHLNVSTLLAWHAFGYDFTVWGVLTWPFVQGSDVFGTLIELVILASMWDAVFGGYDRGKTREAIGAMLGGGIALGLALSAISALTGVPLAVGSHLGVSPLLAAFFALYGLRNPDATILLMFIFPVQARLFTWASLLIPALLWLAALPMGGPLGLVVAVGSWGGAYLWFHKRSFRQRPPGKRVQELRRREKEIRRQLQVLQGGKDDDTYH